METAIIILTTILGFIFPTYLIDAIRNEDKNAASSSKTKSCVISGVMVFLILLCIRS